MVIPSTESEPHLPNTIVVGPLLGWHGINEANLPGRVFGWKLWFNMIQNIKNELRSLSSLLSVLLCQQVCHEGSTRSSSDDSHIYLEHKFHSRTQGTLICKVPHLFQRSLRRQRTHPCTLQETVHDLCLKNFQLQRYSKGTQLNFKRYQHASFMDSTGDTLT